MSNRCPLGYLFKLSEADLVYSTSIQLKIFNLMQNIGCVSMFDKKTSIMQLFQFPSKRSDGRRWVYKMHSFRDVCFSLTDSYSVRKVMIGGTITYHVFVIVRGNYTRQSATLMKFLLQLSFCFMNATNA